MENQVIAEDVSNLTIDETVEKLEAMQRHFPEWSSYEVSKLQVMNLRHNLLNYSEGENVRLYFELLKKKYDAIEEEAYEEANLYNILIGDLENFLFPYKTKPEFRNFESKLMKRGKKRENIAFAVENALLNNLKLIKKRIKERNSFADREKVYEKFATGVFPKLLAGMAASPDQINLFINKYMPD